MASFKPEIFQLCKEVAAEFEGWTFVGNVFKNKSLKHTDLIVSPGFNFYGGDNPSCGVQPAVFVENKKSIKLIEKIIGYDVATSFITFQTIRNELQYYPQKMSSITIWRDYFPSFIDDGGLRQPWPEYWFSYDQSLPVLRAMLMDGIALLNKYYDVSSEENLLRNLPPKYQVAQGMNLEYDESKAVMLCIVHILLGDFDFVEHYRSDEFKTELPKRYQDLDAIIAALPELKQRYLETGSVS